MVISSEGIDLFQEPLFKDLLNARFLRRLNRFLVECEWEGKTVRAHLPNPGRLLELLIPGSELKLVSNASQNVKTGFVAVAVKRNGVNVLLHTVKTNDVAHFLIQRGMIPDFENTRIVAREYTFGRRRFDFLLSSPRGEVLLEVKSCTLFDPPVAMFPDAVTLRGQRHLEELAGYVSWGYTCGVLFLIHSPHVRFFLPDYHTDPAFAELFLKFKDKIFYRALTLNWREDMSLESHVGIAEIPWSVLESEFHDCGAYLVVIKVERDTNVEVGALGWLALKRGYYVYVGSAKRFLSQRLRRHLRGGGRVHWHIDYLRLVGRISSLLPVRTESDLECEIARNLGSIAASAISGFGSSDCSCSSHLFYFPENPLINREFIHLLLFYRMGRLVELLKNVNLRGVRV
ncbi:MAG: DNA/RNA nuclease SfsA [Syntrophales bacterium]|nr:DNA/RNA nuclease SfsA [Syntrophales bacterium]